MNYINEYEDMKFEADAFKAAAFISATPFGNFIMQLYSHGLILDWGFAARLAWALLSFCAFHILLITAHARMRSRERALIWLHRRRTR